MPTNWPDKPPLLLGPAHGGGGFHSNWGGGRNSGGIVPQGGYQGGGQGVMAQDPIDALQAAIDNVVPAGSPERAAIDAGFAALKASPEAASIRNAITQMCAQMVPVNPQPPPATPATGVSPGAAVGIGAGGLVVGAVIGYAARGVKR